MKCQNCNAENDKDVIFCKNCGERLVKKSSSATKGTAKKNEAKKSSAEKIISKNTKEKQTYAGRA